MPALEARLDKLNSAHTQALGVSIDSVFVHANFGASLGGISYPLLADFHPKGAMADSMGVYKSDVGITDRATVIIDSKGIVRHASSIGERDMDKMAAICAEIDAEHGGDLADAASGETLEGATLYVRSTCAASRAALLTRDNLHLSGITVKNVSDDKALEAELESVSGAKTAPILVVGGKVIAESAAISLHLATNCSPL